MQQVMIAFKIYKFYTIDHAIHTMTRDTESNKFLHKFISSNNIQCDICSEDIKDHIEYIEDTVVQPKSINLSVINVQLDPDMFDEPDMCKICFANKLSETNQIKFDCGHEFCKDCVINYLRTKITNGKVEFYNIGYDH
jgi:hypothetical protein